MINGDLSFLSDGHVRGWMKRHGSAEAIVMEGLARLHMLSAAGVPWELNQHSRSYESFSLSILGCPTVHLRAREYPGSLRDGRIYLRDAYRQGSVVATWSSPGDVRRWFEGAQARHETLLATV